MRNLLERLVNIDSGVFHKNGVARGASMISDRLARLGLGGEPIPQREHARPLALIFKASPQAADLAVAMRPNSHPW